MLIDGINLVEGSTIVNLTVNSGTSFPANANTAELFFRTDESKLYIYSGAGWVTSPTSGTTLAHYGITDAVPISHVSNETIHLTSSQNTWIDSITVSVAEVNYLGGVTSAIQTQINGKQASDSTLTSLAAYNTNGILTQTATDTFTGRTLTGTAGRISLTNGDGVSGNPTIDLTSGIATPGTYKSVTVDTYGRITAGTNPTTLTGYGITDAQGLDSTLTSLAAYNTNGILTQTTADTFTGRTITGTAGRISLTNGDGVSGNPTIDLTSGIATPGTYKSVTVDTYGRITAGTNPTTVDGFGITDAAEINPGSPKNGDVQVAGSVISIYASGAWRQVFPAVYS